MSSKPLAPRSATPSTLCAANSSPRAMRIHAHPELAFEEKSAAALLTKTAGCSRPGQRRTRRLWCRNRLRRRVWPEARARSEFASPRCASRHRPRLWPSNVIATAGLGAALGLSKLGAKLTGRVRYMGTPAEERGGGKEFMAQAESLEGVDVDDGPPRRLRHGDHALHRAVEVEVVYHGRAAARRGNALPRLETHSTRWSAQTVAIAQLRQHIQQTERIHGIIVDGKRPRHRTSCRNAPPAGSTSCARDGVELAALKKRVQVQAEAGALATGTRLEATWGKVDCLDLKTNWPLAGAYEANAKSLGRELMDPALSAGVCRLDREGNVSYRVPL